MNWKVCDFKPHEKETLRGFFSLQIGDLKFLGFSLHHKVESGARWVNVPSKEFMADGAKQYAPQVEFASDDRRKAFQKWAISELDKILPKTWNN